MRSVLCATRIQHRLKKKKKKKKKKRNNVQKNKHRNIRESHERENEK
jgi:hypothetical protein